MTDPTPVPGTTRYSCPLECGWHYDVPPPGVDRALELGATADPAARDFQEAISSLVRSAALAEAGQTEAAVRQHLGTHTDPAEVAAIEQLLADVGLAGTNWRP